MASREEQATSLMHYMLTLRSCAGWLFTASLGYMMGKPPKLSEGNVKHNVCKSTRELRSNLKFRPTHEDVITKMVRYTREAHAGHSLKPAEPVKSTRKRVSKTGKKSEHNTG